MNRLYLLVPFVLIALFGGVFYRHLQAGRVAAQISADAASLARQKEAAEKQQLERKAKADADQRLAARVAEEKKKEDEKRAQWEAENARITADTAAAASKADATAAQIAELEPQLTSLRATKTRLGDETFELEKSVEQALIAKRNAELEIQRLTAMLAQQAAGGIAPPVLLPAAK
jgi:hypothetical protein